MIPRAWCLAVALVAPLVYVCPCAALEDEPVIEAEAVVLAEIAEAEGEPGKIAVVQVEVGASGQGEPKVFVGPGDCDIANVVALKLDADLDRGWLGVQLAPVPPEVAAQLPSERDGVMVLNVARESPAASAGLERFDVIAAVNGESVGGDVGELAKAIGSLEPGAGVSLAVLRAGSELTLNATLGSRPAGHSLKWLHDFMPEAITRDLFKTHGKIIKKDEDGNWHLDDLGDLELLDDLPAEIRELLPGTAKITTRILADDEESSVNIVVERNGEQVTIEQADGGEIVVTRIDGDGNETQRSYADADALKAGDPDAFELYDQAANCAKVEVEIEPGHGRALYWHGIGDEDGFFSESRGEWQEQMEKAMQEARIAVEAARGSMDDARKMRLHLKSLPGHSLFGADDDDGSFAFGFSMGKATRSFRVNPDGEIEVIIRKDDNEVTRVFRDEADLEQREPELYQAYSRTLSDE